MGWVPVVSAAFSAFSAIRGAQAQNAAAKQQERANAAAMSAAQEEARLTKEDAAFRAEQARKDAAKVRSQQLSLYLKSGVTLDGSPMLVMDETTREGEKNASNILTNADSQSRSILLRGQAGQQPVQRADFFGTAASVLGSAGTAYSAGQDAGYWGKK